MEYAQLPEFIRKKYVLNTTVVKGTDEKARFTEEAAIKCFYDVLTTLDSKASALMRLNGVLIAASAFLLGNRAGGTLLSTTHFDALLVIGCAVLSAASIFACLFVVNVSWRFLGKADLDPSSTKCEITTEVLALEKASEFRQKAYRLAWQISFVASIGFLLEFLWQALHVIESL